METAGAETIDTVTDDALANDLSVLRGSMSTAPSGSAPAITTKSAMDGGSELQPEVSVFAASGTWTKR